MSFQSRYLHEKNFKSEDLYTKIQSCYTCNTEVSKYTSKSEIDRSIDSKNLPISVCENCMRCMLKQINDFHSLLSAYLKD